MTTFKSLEGLTIVGYRYGEAPESGYSYNTRDNVLEPGVSMAQVGYAHEVQSFAVDAQSNKRYYYVGKIANDTGSDDEICLTDVRQITRAEYLNMRKSMIDASNAVVNAYADRKVSLAERGYNGYSIEAAEEYRTKYTK